jgi:hypothetical protein
MIVRTDTLARESAQLSYVSRRASSIKSLHIRNIIAAKPSVFISVGFVINNAVSMIIFTSFILVVTCLKELM